MVAGDFNLDSRDLIQDVTPLLERIYYDFKMLRSRKIKTYYDLIIAIFNYDNSDFKMIDIVFKQLGKHPVTFGDCCTLYPHDEPIDDVLTHPLERGAK